MGRKPSQPQRRMYEEVAKYEGGERNQSREKAV